MPTAVPAGRSNRTVHEVMVASPLLVMVKRPSQPEPQSEVLTNTATGVAADAAPASQIPPVAVASAVARAVASRVRGRLIGTPQREL